MSKSSLLFSILFKSTTIGVLLKKLGASLILLLKSFSNGETVTGQTSNTAGALESSNAVVAAEVDRQSGDILFLENRNPINRTDSQIEDIKVIIEF